MPTALQGHIERIIFYNSDTGYLVARVRPAGRTGTIPVVGTVIQELHEGDQVELQGDWTKHPKYGDQFQFAGYRIVLPTDEAGIERYLGSGLVKGIGKELAKRIVAKFGAETLAIIENEPERLNEVKGVSEKKIASILEKWGEQRELRETLIFFQGHGITPGQATKIFKKYGRAAIAETKRNPYQLVEDIWGIGFKTADDIAMKIGFDPQSPLRAEAAILHTLDEAANEGHVFLPLDELLERCARIVPLEPARLAGAVESLLSQRRLMRSGISMNEKSIYLAPLFFAEKGVAEMLVKFLSQSEAPIETSDDEVDALEGSLAIEFSDEQREAIHRAAEHRLVIITGGPGTGKTTIVRALVELMERNKRAVALAAPTGKAAKRLSEATDRPAITIHRLLEFNPITGEFARGPDAPVECDTLILDECSMIDLSLMYTLLRALPDGCQLVLVGDKDQLPSIRAGNFLSDAIACGRVPTVELKKIYRQSEKSFIAVNAHRIKEGSYPILPESASGGIASDFFFIAEEREEKILATILKLYIERIPRRLYELGLSRYDPFSESIQIIAPMYRGMLGVDNLNSTLQNALNAATGETERGWARNMRKGDKVIQLRNNYKKEVFNGEMGRVLDLDDENKKVLVAFDERVLAYEVSEIDELTLAYALTVHKSQGSEFEAVIMPILMSHYIMLDRNLLYTAVSRAKKLLVIIGSEKAFRYGIRNNKPLLRYTHLMDRLVMLTENLTL